MLIAGVVVGNGLIGYKTEIEAEKTIRSLQTMVRPTALVVREGELQEISTVEVTPGDLCVLRPGSYVPADGRIVEASHLSLDESGADRRKPAGGQVGQSPPGEKYSPGRPGEPGVHGDPGDRRRRADGGGGHRQLYRDRADPVPGGGGGSAGHPAPAAARPVGQPTGVALLRPLRRRLWPGDFLGISAGWRCSGPRSV